MDEYMIGRRCDELEALADALGCRAVFADDRTLQLDLDGAGSYDLFLRCLRVAEDRGLLPRNLPQRSWTSRSKGRHVEIYLDEPMPTVRRILLQAILGSDPVREALNLAEHEAGGGVMCLFQPRTTAA